MGQSADELRARCPSGSTNDRMWPVKPYFTLTTTALFTLFSILLMNIVLTIIYSKIVSQNINNSRIFNRFYLFLLYVVRVNFSMICHFL